MKLYIDTIVRSLVLGSQCQTVAYCSLGIASMHTVELLHQSNYNVRSLCQIKLLTKKSPWST